MTKKNYEFDLLLLKICWKSRKMPFHIRSDRQTHLLQGTMVKIQLISELRSRNAVSPIHACC